MMLAASVRRAGASSEGFVPVSVGRDTSPARRRIVHHTIANGMNTTATTTNTMHPAMNPAS